MAKTTAIHEGLTYEYLVPGLFVLLGGGILFVFNTILAIVVVLFGILMMMLSTGLEVDFEHQRIRKYKSILFLKFGEWLYLRNIVQIELRYNSNSVKIKGPAGTNIVPGFGLPWIAPNPGAAAKTFDLYLLDDVGEEKLLNQFLKYGLAIKVLNVLEKVSRIKIINHFDTMMKTQRSTRR
jgi:hypothetical protein